MPRKYEDFVESEPEMKPAKKAPWNEDNYVGITCPHCNTLFVELTVDSLKSSKASQCLKHLRVCTKFEGDVSAAPERKYKDPAVASLVAKMASHETAMEEMKNTLASHESTIASHEAMVDVLVNDYGMFRPLTDQNVRPQIKMLIDTQKGAEPSASELKEENKELKEENKELLKNVEDLTDKLNWFLRNLKQYPDVISRYKAACRSEEAYPRPVKRVRLDTPSPSS